jgi:hypothetical protein
MFTTLPERDKNRLSKFGHPFAKRFYIVLLLFFCAMGAYAQHVVSTTVSHGATQYPVDAKVKRVNVDAWGAGGGGGGVDGGSSDTRGSGGGAGGAFKRTTNVTVTPSSNVAVSIGTGGTGSSGAAAGGAGGNTTFSSAAPVTANGGAGGGFANSGDNTGAGAAQTTAGSPTAIGGAGGTAPGGGTATHSGGGGAAGGPGGPGGDASGATAGNSPDSDPYDGATGRNSVGNGDPAPGIGGGGAGGFQVNSNTNVSGGNGGNGQIIVSYTLPTGAVTIDDADGYVKDGQVVRITVIFSEAVNDSPVPQLALSGLYTVAMGNMTKVSSTEYYRDHTVQTGNGTLTVSLGTGEATSTTNVVHDVPTSGATFTVDNTAPTLSITRNAVTLGSFTRTTDQNISFALQFSEPLIASTFDITDIAVVKDAGVGHTALIGTDLVNSGDNINYTLTILDLTGDGNIGISVGPSVQDRATNSMGAAQNSANFTIDNTVPLISSINRATTSPTNANNVDFNVTFSENVVNVGTNDFTVPVTLTAVGSLSGVTGSGSSYVVSVNSVDGNGTLGVNAKDQAATVTISDEAGNDFVAGFTGQTYTIDNQVPSVSSVVRASTNPTNAENVDYTVTFDESVNNVGTNDFVVTTTNGTATGVVNSVSGTGTTYTVNVNALAGTGKIRLDVKNQAASVTIEDPSTNAFVAGFTGGEEYDVDRDIPTVTSVNRASTNPTNAASVDYTVVFSESINGLDDTDFSIVTVSGAATGSVTGISGSGATYTVTVGTLSGDGEFRLDVKTSGGGATIQDPIGNVFTAGFTGEVYERDATAPSIVSLLSNATPAGALIIGQSITFTATMAVTEPGLVFAPTTAGYNNEDISWSTPDGGATYVAIYTISAGDLDQTAPLQLTGVTATDGASNVSNIAATSNVAKTIDANAPSAPAATVATIGGTIVAGYYNISNTDIRFTVPIPTNGVDASLLNGSVQILIDNQTDAGFINLGAAATISGTDQGTSMLVTIPNATIILNGRYANGNTLKFRVRVSDASGNQATTATLGTQLVVDRTAPTTPTALDLTAATDSYGGATGSVGTNADNKTNHTNPVITGSGENGSTVTLSSDLSGTLPSGVVGSGTFSIAVGAITEGSHTITAQAVDVAGNVSGTSTSIVVEIDRTAPTRTAVSFNDNGGSRELVVISFSETIDLANAAVPHLGGGTGFTTSQNSIRNDGTTAYSSGGNTITLESNNNGGWSQAATTWSYTASGSASPSTTNYVKDIFGNEMITGLGFNSSDLTPPTLATGIVFNPNGIGPEIVTFELSETLSLAEGAAVTGFSPSMGAIGSATYTGKGSTNTITLTSGGNGQWNDAVTFAYSLTGNVTDASASLNELAAFAAEPVLLRAVSITENNPAVGYARVGNTITISFFASRVLTPTATIGGLTATIGGSYPNFTASVLATSAIADGTVAFEITATEASKTTITTFTTNGSSVTFDKTAPTITPVSISSNNDNGNTLAKPGNTITLSFTVNETLNTTPTVTIAGRTASVSNVLLDYTATLVLDGSETAGTLGFNISLADIAGNTAGATAITTGSDVTYDKTAPTVQSITLNDSPPHNTGAVTFDVVFSENVTNFQTSDIAINGTAAAGMIGITGSGASYVVTLSQISNEGTLGITIIDDNLSIEDAYDNRLVSDFASTTYNVTVPAPTADPAGFSITAVTHTTMTLSWTDVGTYPIPNGYFITIERDLDVAPDPVNGNSYADQLDLIGNPTGRVHVSQGIESITLTLLSGHPYRFRIFPYTNANSNRVYKTDSPGNDTDDTPIASSGFIDSNSSAANAATIPSTTTAAFPVGRNMHFLFQDDGLAGDDDNAKLLFSTLTFSKGLGNTVPDWSHVIAEAQLREPATGQTITTTNITQDAITFNTPFALPTDIGQIADNGLKIYELRIRLRAPMDNSALIRTLIDGRRFEFIIDGDNGLGYEPGSSKLQSGQTGTSDLDDSNSNATVTVAPTHLRFATQPSNALLGIDMSPTVQVEATDINGNRDLNYGDAGTITSTGVLKFDGVTYFNPVNITFSSGLASAPINHVTRGTGFTITPNSTPSSPPLSLPLITAPSNTFDINVSNQSDIVLDNSFVEPADILYANYQATDIVNGTGSIEVARFTVRDGGVTMNDADAAWTILSEITFNVTNHQAIRRIAIYDEFGNEYQELPSAASVTFNSLWFGSGFWVQDNNYQNFIIRVSFQNSPTFITDNSRIQFTIADVKTASVESSHFVNGTAGTGATTSIAGTDNQIEVVASKYVFTTAPTSSVYVNVPFSPAPLVAEARDANEALDLDYNTAISITNAGGVKMTDTNNPVAATSINDSFVSGVLTFESDFRYAERGNGNGRLNIAPAPTATPFNSAAISILISNSSDIIEETTFTYPDNITYIDYQAGDVDLTSAGDEIEVAQFRLRDDAGASNADLTDTELTSIKFNIANHAFINKLALYVGTTEIKEVAVTSNTVTFDAFSVAAAVAVTAADQGDVTLRLFATFNTTNIVDNSTVSFTVSEALTNPNKSAFAALNAGGATTTITGDENKMEVEATLLHFLNPTGPTNASLNTPFAVSVEARDINANRDLDFHEDITDFDNTGGLTMEDEPDDSDPANAFVSGFFAFNPNFRYTSDDGGTIGAGTLEIEAGGLDGVSPSITVRSSFESSLEILPTPTDVTIDYINYQGTGPGYAVTVSNSFILTSLELYDGDADGDSDGANTVLNSFTVSITNPSNIRKVALFDASNTIIPGTEQAAAASITFNGLSITATDINSPAQARGITPFTIRAIFMNDATNVHDGQQIQVHITAATEGIGSKFINGPDTPTPDTDFVGGIDNGSLSPVQNIEVTATQLDFMVQPPSFAGINVPFSTALEIRARDANAIVDVDQDDAGAAPADGAISTPVGNGAGVTVASYPFASGVMAFPGFNYTSVGDGTVKVTTTNKLGATIQGTSNHVDVIHVSTTLATGGVFTGALAGGAISRVIFGVTFKAPYTITGQPKLDKFTISFATLGTIVGVFNNVKIFESSSDNIYSPGGSEEDITGVGIGGVITLAAKSVTVDFTQPGGVPRDLSTALNNELTYFLMVDVDNSANASTPLIQPRLEDGGLLTPTDGNIVLSNGTATSALVGTNFGFAAVNAPVVISSYPARGQLNVAVDQPEIELVYSVPVWTLDSKIYLHKYKNGIIIAELPAVNGQYNQGNGELVGTASNPLRFTLPLMEPDSMYYISIPQGDFKDQLSSNNVGIMDTTRNESPGFTYRDVLYFKTANPNAPKLMTAPAAPKAPSITNISISGATINGIFDQQGKAYYLVVSNSSPAPTTTQIKDPLAPYGGTVLSRGNFDITQTETITQFGVMNGAFTLGTTYHVWVFAESYSSKNHVLAPIPTSAPYGNAANTFAVGATGPTLTFTPTTPLTGITIFKPNLTICSNSYQILNSPIVIVEGAAGDFYTNSNERSFNLLLPSGYQFDDSKTAGVPNYGKVTLHGADFVAGSGTLSYINNSILRITYKSAGSATIDNISITNLRVIGAASSPSGNIVRLGGDAFPSITDNTIFGSILTVDAAPLDFTNSYSETEYPGREFPITIIPDNFNAPTFTAKLIPLHPTGDFGSTSFSGTGVNVDQLNLSAATLGIPFNVTARHVDNNGCVSENPVQYTIYDHENAIGGLATEYCIRNGSFPNDATADNDTIHFDNNPSSYMYNLTIGVPSSASATQIIKNTTEWRDILESMIVGTEDHFTDFHSYIINVAPILNAGNTPGIPNPYSHFLRRTPIQNNIFYTGGSLGFVEFTAEYRGRVNTQLEFPLKQNVEYFVPAIPIVEVDPVNQVDTDSTDVLNAVTPDTPVLSGIEGTPIFCVNGGMININGYPRAEGNSEGRFELLDADSETLLVLPAGAFTDNGNGTAALDPTKFTNAFRDIRIDYYYKEDGSPCESSGSLIIRITPNPTASFTAEAVISPKTPFGTSYCENNRITFNGEDQSTIVNGTIAHYQWDFNDAINAPSEGDNENTPGGAPLVAGEVNHSFVQSAQYNVSLVVTSEFNCKSSAYTVPINVGTVPTVQYNFGGESVADPIWFNGSASVLNNPTSVNHTAQMLWTFGDSQSTPVTTNFTNDVTHAYLQPGTFTTNLQVTTTRGCRNAKSKQIIVLPHAIPTAANPYEETFENSNGGNWIPSSLPISSSATNPSSWAFGTPTTTVIRIEPTITGSTVWKTNLSGPYNPKERSALYSPSFDLRGLTRPMISFNSFTQIESSDGVILEYSVDGRNVADSLKVWHVLGEDTDEGLGWFNVQGIAAKPGNQPSADYGWSGNEVMTWADSRHAIENYTGKPAIEKQPRVVFRFALASAKENPSLLNGFAFDNFRVGNSTRTVLVENFSNTSSVSSGSLEHNETYRNFNSDETGVEIVKIDYHVAFPGEDPFNAENPADPGARALYYGVSTLPQARLDGSSFETETVKFPVWGPAEFSKRVLELGNATIGIGRPVITDGTMNFKVKFTPLMNLPGRTILHVAIVEEQILVSLNSDLGRINSNEEEFRYVLKKMLPNAAGTVFTDLVRNVSPSTGTDSLSFSWERGEMLEPEDDIAIVVFLQDELSRKIYQSEIRDSISDPEIITGIEDLNNTFKVYPNPADKEMMIELPTALSESSTLQMFDQMGKVIEKSMLDKGQKTKTIDTSEMAGGVYLIQINTPKGILRRKVMVLHNN